MNDTAKFLYKHLGSKFNALNIEVQKPSTYCLAFAVILVVIYLVYL